MPVRSRMPANWSAPRIRGNRAIWGSRFSAPLLGSSAPGRGAGWPHGCRCRTGGRSWGCHSPAGCVAPAPCWWSRPPGRCRKNRPPGESCPPPRAGRQAGEAGPAACHAASPLPSAPAPRRRGGSRRTPVLDKVSDGLRCWGQGWGGQHRQQTFEVHQTLGQSAARQHQQPPLPAQADRQGHLRHRSIHHGIARNGCQSSPQPHHGHALHQTVAPLPPQGGEHPGGNQVFPMTIAQHQQGRGRGLAGVLHGRSRAPCWRHGQVVR